MLGDFLPQPLPGFDVLLSYERTFRTDNGQPTGAVATDPDVGIGPGFREIVLSTDAQAFPLPSGGTPGITQPVTVVGGRFP